MKTLKPETTKWASRAARALFDEVRELSGRLDVEIKALKQSAPGSDSSIDHWSEAAVQLSWLQGKIEDLLAEMGKLEETWPE